MSTSPRNRQQPDAELSHDASHQAAGNTVIVSFDEAFKRLHETSCRLISNLTDDLLYRAPRQAPAGALPFYSCGEHILRSAGRIEQAFGGLTINLWDDPFEWTLPEALPQTADVLNYLNEAETMRAQGFAILRSDADLTKRIALPSGALQPIIHLLIETLREAAFYQGRAFEVARLIHKS